MLRLVVLMLLACAAAATHPLCSHCAESPPLPLLYFLPSLLSLSLCSHGAVTQSCVQHGGDPAAELPLFYLPNVLLSPASLPFLPHRLLTVRALKLWNASRLLDFPSLSCLHGTSLLETDGEEEE